MEILLPVSILSFLSLLVCDSARSTKFYPNWTISDRVMTICRFFKMVAIWQPYRRKSTSAFRLYNVSHMGEQRTICIQNFLWIRIKTSDRVITSYRFSKMVAIRSQTYFRCWIWLRLTDVSDGIKLFAYHISTKYLNSRLRYYNFQFIKTNGRHIEILLPVSTLTFLLSSTCDSALAYQILCKFDDRRRRYDAISIIQDGGHSVSNLLPVSGLATSDIEEGLKLSIGIPNFDQIPQSTVEISLLPVSENKRPSYWNSTSGFDFDFFTVIAMWFFVGIPNFIGIGSSAAELWRHIDFQDGGLQRCWIWFSVMVAHPRRASGGLCFVLKFRLDRIYSFEHRGVFIF